MDLLYIDLTYKVPSDCLSNASLPYIALTSFLMAPLRVIGLNYQLSSSITQTSVNESLKYFRAWNSKSYKFGKIIPDRKMKIPIFKNYKELFAKLSNRKMRVYYSATLLESLYWWICFQYKITTVALMGESLSKNQYVNISILAGVFSILDVWVRPIEVAITRLTYNELNYFKDLEKLDILNWKHYLYDSFLQNKDIINENHKDPGLFWSPFADGLVIFSKLVCWFYALTAYGNGWTTEKSIDMLLLHTLLYPAITAQRRCDVQDHFCPFRYKNAIHALIKIYFTEGIIDGLYRGFIFNTLYALPKYYLIPSLFYTYSNAKYAKYLDQHKD